MGSIIELREVGKDFVTGLKPHTVLDGLSLTVEVGEFVAIVGPSGNGKSTLLNLITGIDRPTRGEIEVSGARLRTMSEEALAKWRGTNVGIVFQFFQLLPSLSLLQNVILPMDLVGVVPRRQRRDQAMQLLETVRLDYAADLLPSQISGGQQQRVAIARALANDPPLIVADEPTGNLDATTADDVFTLFSSLLARGKTLIMVTHNEALARSTTRCIGLRAGRIEYDSARLPSPLERTGL
jgi:putative ABC transport system ATP-binding protein